MSARVMETLSHFAPEVEIYSIDEAFLVLTGLRLKDLEEYGRKIRKTIIQWTGIPVSVGISTSKTLAKVANHWAKRVPGFKGSLALMDEDRIAKALQKTPVGEVWGIGRQYEKFLIQNGINNAWQLRNANEKFVDHYMTVVGHKTVLELQGFSAIEMERSPVSQKEHRGLPLLWKAGGIPGGTGGSRLHLYHPGRGKTAGPGFRGGPDDGVSEHQPLQRRAPIQQFPPDGAFTSQRLYSGPHQDRSGAAQRAASARF
jgi:hypothetical protein